MHLKLPNITRKTNANTLIFLSLIKGLGPEQLKERKKKKEQIKSRPLWVHCYDIIPPFNGERGRGLCIESLKEGGGGKFFNISVDFHWPLLCKCSLMVPWIDEIKTKRKEKLIPLEFSITTWWWRSSTPQLYSVNMHDNIHTIYLGFTLDATPPSVLRRWEVWQGLGGFRSPWKTQFRKHLFKAKEGGGTGGTLWELIHGSTTLWLY